MTANTFMIELETKRLRIRELSMEDLDKIHDLHSLPEIDEFNTLGIPTSKNVTNLLLTDWLGYQEETQRCSYVLCIEFKNNHQFVGLISLYLGKERFKKAEVSFKIHKDFFGHGYTTEALIELLNYAFTTLKLHRIEAGCAVGNIASKKVLERVGMKQEGYCRQILPIRGQWVDGLRFAILESDYIDKYHLSI